MAQQIGSMYASLTMDTGQYAASWALADRITARGTSRIRKEAGLAQASIDRFSKSTSTGIRPYGLIAVSRAFERVNDRVGLLRGTMLATTAVFGGLTAALGSNLILRYADTYTNLSNQIRVVSEDSVDLAGQLAAVSAAANNSRASLQATATLYARLAKAAPSRTNSEVLDYVQTIQKALALGGATAQEAASAAIQFSQAIASNRLGGEELRAVLETPLGLALAKGLGVTIGKLREMGHAGELTADRVLGALSKVKGDIDEQFGKSVRTIDQSLVQADNQLTKYIGTLDKTYGLTRLVSGGILSFANNIDTVATTVANLGLAFGAAFGGRLIGRNVGKAVDSTFGEISRRAEAARSDVLNLTKAQSELSDQLEKSTRAFSGLSKRDNMEFASKSDLKAVQREEAKLNKLREERLATTTRMNAAIASAGAVEVKTSKQALASGAKIVETQGKIEASLARQTTLTNELQKAESRLTAAKGQQSINTAKIGAVKEAERDIIRIRQAQIVELEKVGNLEQSVATQRITLAGRIGDAEAKAAEQKAKFQAVARASAAETAKLQIAEYNQLQRLGRVRAGVGEIGSIGKASEIRNAQAALAGLQTRLQGTAQSLAAAIRGTSILNQSFSLLKSGAASLVGFLGGPWGVAFTGAIAVMALLGIRSARTAAEIANTKKAVEEDLAEIAKTPGKIGDAAASSTKRDQLQGELDAVVEKIALYRKAIETEGKSLEEAVRQAFQPFVDLQISQGQGFTGVLDAALAQVSEIVKQVQVGDIAASQIGESVRAIPEFKFADDNLVPDIIRAASEMAKFGSTLDFNEKKAKELGTSLRSSTGDLEAVDQAQRAYAQLGQSIADSEAALGRSSKLVATLIAETKALARETELEGSIRKATAEILKDNKDLTSTNARELAVVNTVLEVIRSSSSEWLASTEATTGEFGRLLAIAKLIAPELDFAKQALNSTQLAAVNDMLASQTKIAKIESQRVLLGERERAVLEEQDRILGEIRTKYGTIEGANLDGVRRTAEALVDFDRGADAITRANEAITSLTSSTASLGGVAANSVNQYVRSLNGAGSLLESFRAQQTNVLAQFLEVQQQTTDVTAALGSYRGELQRLISASATSLFGGLENTSGVRTEIAAAGQAIAGLAQRFFDGKITAAELTTGMTKIEDRLKALGADTDALKPFTRNILAAIQKISELLQALGILKRAQASIGSPSAFGGTGTRTVDPTTGVGVARFGSPAANDNGDVVRSVENNVRTTRYGLDQTTQATDRVDQSIGNLNNDVGGYIGDLNTSLGGGLNAITNALRSLSANTAAGANTSAGFGMHDGTDGGPIFDRFGFDTRPIVDPDFNDDGPNIGESRIKIRDFYGGEANTRDGSFTGDVNVGDIIINGNMDGAEAGRQAGYELVRTVQGVMTRRL